MMAEQAKEELPQSETRNGIMHSVSYIVAAALSMQGWSGSLDWSKRLVKEGVLTSPELIRSFSKVKRRDFLPEEQKPDEGYDWPLQVGQGQTNSQPSLVGGMLELLKPRRGHAILDVGSGSGWTTALLASVAGKDGRVIGTERIPELAEIAKENLAQYDFPSARVEHTESGLGMPSEGPYNRILVSAHMLEEWVPELSSQLSPRGGIMVAPIATKANHGKSGYNQQVAVITRHGADFATATAMEEVGFVPLIHDAAVA
jgi:protein-L-isoaspartate(D-aspartate) O-methyltransferase